MLEALERVAQELVREPCENIARRLFFRQSLGWSLPRLRGKFGRDPLS
jgi:hypothetical protein